MIWNLKPHQQTFPTVTHENPDGLSYTMWMDHLPKDDFVSSCIGHWENTGSPSYADLLNVYTFHCNTLKKKNHIWYYYQSR